MKEVKIENARISGTSLGVEGHGIFTSWVMLEFDGGGVGFGGYVLGGESGIKYLERVLEVVGVENWEDLKGKYVRVKSEGWGGKALAIGNVIKDQWLDHEEFFSDYK